MMNSMSVNVKGNKGISALLYHFPTYTGFGVKVKENKC